MSLYPIFLDLNKHHVLVAGAGVVAARKVKGLLESKAYITVVAPVLCSEMHLLLSSGKIAVISRAYRTEDLNDKRLVIAATGQEEVNLQVFNDCRKQGIFCNVVDEPNLCDFHIPARVKQGLLQIAISTGGASPAMAGRIRRTLEKEFGHEYEILMKGLLELRKNLKAEGPSGQEERRHILNSFLNSGAPDMLLEDGNEEAFYTELNKWKTGN